MTVRWGISLRRNEGALTQVILFGVCWFVDYATTVWRSKVLVSVRMSHTGVSPAVQSRPKWAIFNGKETPFCTSPTCQSCSFHAWFNEEYSNIILPLLIFGVAAIVTRREIFAGVVCGFLIGCFYWVGHATRLALRKEINGNIQLGYVQGVQALAEQIVIRIASGDPAGSQAIQEAIRQVRPPEITGRQRQD